MYFYRALNIHTYHEYPHMRAFCFVLRKCALMPILCWSWTIQIFGRDYYQLSHNLRFCITNLHTFFNEFFSASDQTKSVYQKCHKGIAHLKCNILIKILILSRSSRNCYKKYFVILFRVCFRSFSKGFYCFDNGIIVIIIIVQMKKKDAGVKN